MIEKKERNGRLINSVVKMDKDMHRDIKIFAAKRAIRLSDACIELIKIGLSQERD